jgi:hypothetical protein
MSISTKKRDKDTKGSSAIEESSDYTIGTTEVSAGTTNIVDTQEAPSRTVDKVARRDDITNNREETMISSPSPSQVNMPTEPTVTTSSFDQYQHQQQNYQQQSEEQQSKINRALDETRENIRKSTDEARKDIPRYTQAASEYQEQTIEIARELADTFLESQKQILSSLESAWLPQIDAANRVFTSSWMSPRQFAQIYANMISNFADNIVMGTRLTNRMMFANMEALKTLTLQTKDNAKEFSRSNVNAARSLEQTSRDAAKTLGEQRTSYYTRDYTETEERDRRREKHF